MWIACYAGCSRRVPTSCSSGSSLRYVPLLTQLHTTHPNLTILHNWFSTSLFMSVGLMARPV